MKVREKYIESDLGVLGMPFYCSQLTAEKSRYRLRAIKQS